MSEPTSPNERENMLHVNGIDMFYTRKGAGDPLILLHGGTGSHHHWDQHIPLLSPKFELIIPDLRGHGKSTNPINRLEYHQMADDIAVFIQDLKLDQPLVCGWSDGGQIALELAIRHANLVKGFAIGAVIHKLIEEYVQAISFIGFPAPGEVNIEKITASSPEWVENLHRWHQQSEDHWINLLHQISFLWYTDFNYPSEILEQVDCPILLILGDRDDIIPLEHMIDLYHALPNAGLAVIPFGRHQVDRYRPEIFCRLITDYFDRVLAGEYTS